VEGITVASVLSLESTGIDGTEFDTPEPDSFATDSDTTLSQEIFYISMAEIEAIVQPDSVTDDVGRESVTLICIHAPILSSSVSLLGDTFNRTDAPRIVLF
ncbi:MAG: hypothetical protein ACJAYC_003930, partial [Halieaceae bacterium]